ncbi:MAG: LysR substrate-binding domain-containing protein, partial [Rhodoplanes sp.]
LYAARGYVKRRPRTTDLAAHDWIGFDESLRNLGSALWMEAHVPKDRVVCRANSLVALRAFARAGLGVAALPCYLGDREKGLVRIHAPLPEMSAGLWLLTHPDLRRVARVRAVLDVMAGELTRLRAVFEGKRQAQPRT